MQNDDISEPSLRSSDQILLARFRAGDEDAALQLYFRYANRLLRLANKETGGDLGPRFDAEDIVQSVFRTFFRRAATGQYEAPEGDELWKLLLVMALNKLRTRSSYHRARKRDVRKTQSIEANDTRLDPESREEAKTVLQISIEEIIELQPESHRDVIRLRIEGYNVQEIADSLRKSKRTVERVLQSFRNELMNSTLLSCHDENSADLTESSQ